MKNCQVAGSEKSGCPGKSCNTLFCLISRNGTDHLIHLSPKGRRILRDRGWVVRGLRGFHYLVSTEAGFILDPP